MNYKKSNRTLALEAADRWLSLWFRANEADENGNVVCCTCHRTMEWRAQDGSTQFGHWKNRDFKRYRYDPRNGGVQCRQCNEAGRGMPKSMEIYLILKHGADVVAAIEENHRLTYPLSNIDLEEIADHYRTLFEQVIKEKGLYCPPIIIKQKNAMTKTFCDGCTTEITNGGKTITLQTKKYELCPTCYRLVVEAAIDKIKSIPKK